MKKNAGRESKKLERKSNKGILTKLKTPKSSTISIKEKSNEKSRKNEECRMRECVCLYVCVREREM